MKGIKTVSRTPVLQRDHWLTVEDHVVELPDGERIERWPWVVTPDFVNVMAVTASGRFLCFRQTKYAVEGISLAPAGGYIDPGEDPLQAARRELREETGHGAERWHHLGSYAVDGNRGAGTAHLYLALDARPLPGGGPASDDLEEMELVQLNRDEVAEALDQGAFKVLPWTAVAALALRYLQ